MLLVKAECQSVKMNNMLSRFFFLIYFVMWPVFAMCQWVEFTDVSTVVLPPGLVDTLEKDIAVGDLDKNGFTDVIVVRKKPFSNIGAGQDLLLLNNGYRLRDSTASYAPGFLSNPSDSRDVTIGDFDGDSWLDVVITNTFEDQPIFYRNMGESNGKWLGLMDESEQRFPLPLDVFPLQFCAAWAGDVTGDGALDLYFSNYGANLGQGGVDDVLLINDGNGFFTDESEERLGILRKSAFGTSCEIYDMDGDGDNDIVKISTLYNVAPWNKQGVFVLFNDGTGHFSNWQIVPSPTNAVYMFTVGELNGDTDLRIRPAANISSVHSATAFCCSGDNRNCFTANGALLSNSISCCILSASGFGRSAIDSFSLNTVSLYFNKVSYAGCTDLVLI